MPIAASIAAVPGVDLLLVGPADLGLRLPDELTLDMAVEQVAQAAKSQQKAWGILTESQPDLFRYRQMGAQLLPIGHEYELFQTLEKASQTLHQLAEEGHHAT